MAATVTLTLPTWSERMDARGGIQRDGVQLSHPHWEPEAYRIGATGTRWCMPKEQTWRHLWTRTETLERA